MNLAAYLQIPDLEHVLQENHIEVPRLRGLALMSEHMPYTREEMQRELDEIKCLVYDLAVTSVPPYRPDSCMSEYSRKTKLRKAKYLIREKEESTRWDGEPYTWYHTVGFRWDLVHGKNKKAVKLAVKKRCNKMLSQMELWNKYAGRSDVIQIHARIGGDNWEYFGGEKLRLQPWFLEKVDDAYDCTYCDIYAKIGV